MNGGFMGPLGALQYFRFHNASGGLRKLGHIPLVYSSSLDGSLRWLKAYITARLKDSQVH